MEGGGLRGVLLYVDDGIVVTDAIDVNSRRRRKVSGELPKIIAIVGTNASGKSAVGLELAKSFGGEIISADSRQVYRGFDLCSGKITAEEARAVPHHLIDIKDIGEAFSVSDFQNMAYSLIPQILQRDKVPFIVGGTGNYVKSVVSGYVLSGEPVDAALRGKLDKLTADELLEMLTPEGKAFFASNPSDSRNKRRLIRAIEKTALGEPLRRENSARYSALQIGVTWPKDILHRRIEERLASRIELGMIDEVKTYLDGGGDPECLYDLGLEYRYILWYLTGKFKSQDEFKLELARAIKRFAKRQMTWLRRDESIIWLDMNGDYMEQARSLTADFLER